MVGDFRDNRFSTGDGDDTIEGGTGKDDILAGSGDDLVLARGDGDRLELSVAMTPRHAELREGGRGRWSSTCCDRPRRTGRPTPTPRPTRSSWSSRSRRTAPAASARSRTWSGRRSTTC
ncbi:hypothetical protein AB5I41_09010 [Sphingomonas sp. MMS24-JH45]